MPGCEPSLPGQSRRSADRSKLPQLGPAVGCVSAGESLPLSGRRPGAQRPSPLALGFPGRPGRKEKEPPFSRRETFHPEWGRGWGGTGNGWAWAGGPGRGALGERGEGASWKGLGRMSDL